MKYKCDFVHPKTRERRTIVVDLNKTDVAALEQRRAVVGEATLCDMLTADCREVSSTSKWSECACIDG